MNPSNTKRSTGAAVNMYRAGSSGLILAAKKGEDLPNLFNVALRVDDLATFNDLEIAVNQIFERDCSYRDFMHMCADFIERRLNK